MVSVRLTGWRTGCNTVEAIKTLRDLAQLPLNEALATVNRVVAGECVEICTATEGRATQLVAMLDKHGVLASYIVGPSITTTEHGSNAG